MNWTGLFNFECFFNTNSWFMPSFGFKPMSFFSPWNFFNSIRTPFFNIFDDYNTPPANTDRYEVSDKLAQVVTGKNAHNNADSVSDIGTPVIKRSSKNVNKKTKIQNKKKVQVKSSSNKKSEKSVIKQSHDNIQIKGYDKNAGEKLANVALKKVVGWTGYCARYVKNAIKEAGLGAYVSGHAFQMAGIMRKNNNFRELSPYQVDVNKLPAGCVLVYGKGVSGYNSKYGHVEITTGDGRAVSDGITKSVHKKPTAIFMPVEQNSIA